MSATPEEDKLHQELKALYPNLTHEQLIEAGENLDLYIEHTIQQFERIREDPERYKKFLALTGREPSRYDDGVCKTPPV
jgi:hypothetical protein